MGKRFNHQEIIAGYLRAFRAANGHSGPEVAYEKGWFTLKHPSAMVGTKHRRIDIKRMTERLNERAAVRAAQRDMETGR